MSRFSYDDDEGAIPYGLYCQIVRRAISGKPGQKALRELEAALLALPEKRLIESEVCDDGEVCALGALAIYRRVQAGDDRAEALVDLQEDWGYASEAATVELGEALGLRQTLATEIVWINDEELAGLSPDRRYTLMLEWVQRNLVPA